ncbi:hypothetical protein B0H14DRAFT_3173795, partial [Mycena olivaceomarginata]
MYPTRMRAYNQAKAANHSDRCGVNYKIEISRLFLNDTFYLPQNVDFRGRSARGFRWLKIHLSNLYGYDEANFDEHAAFTDDYMEDIYDSVLHPLDGRGWCGRSVAVPRNVHGSVFGGDPEAYESVLPVHQDGICNGLQHYAALGGRPPGYAPRLKEVLMCMGTVNTMKQASAFPPNFIHILDATHRMSTAIECRVQGLTFASVHDSYWTHACSIEHMSEIIRDTFIALHSSDVLQKLEAEVLPEALRGSQDPAAAPARREARKEARRRGLAHQGDACAGEELQGLKELLEIQEDPVQSAVIETKGAGSYAALDGLLGQLDGQQSVPKIPPCAVAEGDRCGAAVFDQPIDGDGFLFGGAYGRIPPDDEDEDVGASPITIILPTRRLWCRCARRQRRSPHRGALGDEQLLLHLVADASQPGLREQVRFDGCDSTRSERDADEHKERHHRREWAKRKSRGSDDDRERDRNSVPLEIAPETATENAPGTAAGVRRIGIGIGSGSGTTTATKRKTSPSLGTRLSSCTPSLTATTPTKPEFGVISGADTVAFARKFVRDQAASGAAVPSSAVLRSTAKREMSLVTSRVSLLDHQLTTMPKLTPEQKKIQELTAALALKDKKIEKLEKQKNTSKRQKLIPKPKGQAGRSAESGGYNVQITLGLNNQDYNRRRRIIKRYVHEYLSVNSPISQQETGAVARMVAKVQQDLPYFAQFEHGWPIRDITRIYLSNEQTRKGRDEEAEARAYPGAQPTTTQPSTTTKMVKKKKAVVFIDTDDADASDEEDEPLRKRNRSLPKKKAVKTVRSETEEDSDKEDDAEENFDADYIDDVDMPESDSDLELLVNRPTKPPIKTPKTSLGNIMDVSEPPQNNKNKENKPPVGKKRKAEELPALAGSPAKKSSKIRRSPRPPSAKPSAKSSKANKIPLAWSDLPTTCPSVFCSHPLPATPVPRLLTLFQRAHDLQKTGGPQAKGLALTHLEICSLITIERRRFAIVALGKRRDWPATIDWGDSLDECPIWTDFLLAIDDNLFEFMASNNKDEFQPAIKHKSCG